MLLSRKDFLKLTGNAMMALGAMNSGMIRCGKISTGGEKLEYKVKELRLVHTWTTARNSADVKNNVFVRYENDGTFGIGEAAPNIRYNETTESTI